MHYPISCDGVPEYEVRRPSISPSIASNPHLPNYLGILPTNGC